MTFTGFPLDANWNGDDANLNQHAEAHNTIETAANELQGMIVAIQEQMATMQAIDMRLGEFLALFEQPILYTPTLTNVTVGASPGEAWGRYGRIGNLIFLEAGFRLGAGFTMTSGPFGLNLPFPCNIGPTEVRRSVFCSYANNSNASRRTSGAGIVLQTTPILVSRFANEQTGLGWSRSTPFTWEVGDTMEFSGHYWAVPD